MKTEIRKILADKTETLEDGRVVIVPDFSQLDDLVDDLDTLFSLHFVNNRRELLIGLLAKLENGGGSKFIDKEEIRGKSLKEWKEYCKSDNVPIKTVKYITCLEERIESLTIPVVVGTILPTQISTRL